MLFVYGTEDDWPWEYSSQNKIRADPFVRLRRNGLSLAKKKDKSFVRTLKSFDTGALNIFFRGQYYKKIDHQCE